MDQKGQITLEIVIMLLLVLSIYLYVSNPMGDVSRAATRDVGVAALAAQTVDQIAQKTNMVALSGSGSKDYLEIQLVTEFQHFECGGRAIRLTFSKYTAIEIDNPPGLGVHALLEKGNRTYPASGIFNTYDNIASCNLSSLPTGEYTACVCFKSEQGNSPLVDITAFQKPLGGCNCP